MNKPLPSTPETQMQQDMTSVIEQLRQVGMSEDDIAAIIAQEALPKPSKAQKEVEAAKDEHSMARDASIERRMRAKKVLPVCDTEKAAENRQRVDPERYKETERNIFDIRSYKVGGARETI